MGNITLNKPSGGQLTIAPEDGTSNETVTIPSVGVGKVLQVKQTSFGGTWSGGGDGTIFYSTPLTVDITPTSATSKILVSISASIGSGYWEIEGRLTRNGTVIGAGDPRGSRKPCLFLDNRYEGSGSVRNSWGTVTAQYLDSPNTTSSCTYLLQLNGYSSYTVGLNYNPYDDSNGSDYYGQPISTITVTEVAA